MVHEDTDAVDTNNHVDCQFDNSMEHTNNNIKPDHPSDQSKCSTPTTRHTSPTGYRSSKLDADSAHSSTSHYDEDSTFAQPSLQPPQEVERFQERRPVVAEQPSKRHHTYHGSYTNGDGMFARNDSNEMYPIDKYPAKTQLQPAGFCNEFGYVGRSADASRYSVYNTHPSSFQLQQEAYADTSMRNFDYSTQSLLQKNSRKVNSTTVPVDLSKFDLKLTLGVEGKPYSYAQLITYAIAHSKYGKLTLSEIYEWCLENFPYFKKQTNQGWKNSIRHNLSLNKTFVKVPRPVNEAGKGAYWALDGQTFITGPVTTSESRSRPRTNAARASAAAIRNTPSSHYMGPNLPLSNDYSSGRSRSRYSMSQVSDIIPPRHVMTSQPLTQEVFLNHEQNYSTRSSTQYPTTSESYGRQEGRDYSVTTSYPNFPFGPAYSQSNPQVRSSSDRFELPSLKRDFSAPSGFAPMTYPAPSSHLGTYGISQRRQASYSTRQWNTRPSEMTPIEDMNPRTYSFQPTPMMGESAQMMQPQKSQGYRTEAVLQDR